MALSLVLAIPFYLGLCDFEQEKKRFRLAFCSQLLNIAPTSTDKEIRQAFIKWLKMLHTDRSGSSTTLPRVQELNAASSLYARFQTAVTIEERRLVLGTLTNIARPLDISVFRAIAFDPAYYVEKLSALPGTLMVLSVPYGYTRDFAPWLFVGWNVGRLFQMISSGRAFTLGVWWEIVKYGRARPGAHTMKYLEIGFHMIQNMQLWEMRLFANAIIYGDCLDDFIIYLLVWFTAHFRLKSVSFEHFVKEMTAPALAKRDMHLLVWMLVRLGLPGVARIIARKWRNGTLLPVTSTQGCRIVVLAFIRQYYRVDRAIAMKWLHSGTYRACAFGYGMGRHMFKDLLEGEGALLDICLPDHRRGKEAHLDHMLTYHSTPAQLAVQGDCLYCGERCLHSDNHYDALLFHAEHTCLCPAPRKPYLPGWEPKSVQLAEFPPIEYSRFTELPEEVRALARIKGLKVSKPLLASGEVVFRIYR